MRLVKGSLAGLVMAGIIAMMPAAAFAHGGGGGGGGGHGGGGGGHGFGGGGGGHGFGRGGGGHAFVSGGGHGFGGGHAFGGFTGRGFSPGFSGTRGFSTGRFSGRGDHGRFSDRGFRDHRVFFQQFASPVWYPYYPYDYSYLDYGPDNDYQYWDNSASSVQPESFRPAVDHRPVVVIINSGNSRPTDSSPNTAYIHSGYSSTDAAGQQR